MPDLLLFGDTERSAALRHEIPIAIGDPFLYGEVGGQVYIMSTMLEGERLAAARPDAELVDVDGLGFYELIRSGRSRAEVFIELVSRAAKRMGVREAIVDFDFPLGVAERLRADGIALSVDDVAVKTRRRVKSKAEMAGICRAQRAADAAMAAAAELLRRADSVDGTLHVNGEPLLAEAVRATMVEVCRQHGAVLPPDAIVASAWQGFGHEPGRGPLPSGLPIQIDLWRPSGQPGGARSPRRRRCPGHRAGAMAARSRRRAVRRPHPRHRGRVRDDHRVFLRAGAVSGGVV